MKLTALLLLTFLLKANAEGFAQKVTLSEKDASLETVFKKITRQTGYVFFYSDDLLQAARKVNIEVKDMPLEKALQICFSEQPFEYLISNKTIAVKTRSSVISALLVSGRTREGVRIVGKVVDAVTGEPISGASVVVRKDQAGTSTDSKGVFRLLAENGATVEISYVGYEPYYYKVTGEAEITIRMVPKPQEMKVTVVTGIFNRKASSYTGSAVTITNEELRRVGNANLFQSLRNISPSLMVDNLALGSNPNALPDIQLRGTSTFPAGQNSINSSLKGNYLKSPNEPLFILDGFEASIERIYDLDINRIERVTILKDAASKAIYGAKAANGVVVIETKKSPSGNTLVTYNASVDVDLPDLTSYDLTNSHEKLQAELIDGLYGRPGGIEPAAEYVRLQQLYAARKKLADEGLNTHWMAKPLREGIGHKHTLSVELGKQDLSMMADISYREVNGVMKGSNRKNISGNITTSYRVRNLLFRNIMSANKNTNAESPFGAFNDYAIMNPYWRALNVDGSIPYYAEVSPGLKATNPMWNSTLNTKITEEYFNFTNNFYLEWTIVPGLRAMTRIGIDLKNSDADEFYPAAHTRFENFISEDDIKRKGSYQVNNGKSNKISGDLNVTWTREFNGHFLFANGGFNVNERKYSETIYKVEGFSSDRMENLMLGRGYAVDSRPAGIDGIERDLGFLGSFSYMYDNRYMTDLTYRTTASSQFGVDKRWAQFWSVGLGWNVHNEKFMHNRLGIIDQLKLRGSVGSTGNPNFPVNQSIATYQYFLEALYQGFPGSYLVNMANPALQWETKLDYNAGFDAKIRNLNIRFDYYESYTENLVTSISTPMSTGFGSVMDNLGRVKNSGIELFASWMVWSKGSNFLSLNAGIETNKNRIVELSQAMKNYNNLMDKQAADRSNNKPIKKYVDGGSMNDIWAVPSLGIDPATGNEIYLKKDGSTTYIWNANDMVVAGNSMPAYQGVFGVSAEYNGIGVNITGRYLGGGQLYNQTLVDKVENVDMNYNVDKRVLTGRWQQPGQHALFKKLGNYYAPNPDGLGGLIPLPEKTRATTRFVQDRNELDIAAVNVYYLLNDKLVSKLGMARLKLGFNMNEIAKISSIRIERGTQYPFARTMSFSLSATFK